MVSKPAVFKYLEGDIYNTMWKEEPWEQFSKDGKLVAYQHKGFWNCIDALRHKVELEVL